MSTQLQLLHSSYYLEASDLYPCRRMVLENPTADSFRDWISKQAPTGLIG